MKLFIMIVCFPFTNFIDLIEKCVFYDTLLHYTGWDFISSFLRIRWKY